MRIALATSSYAPHVGGVEEHVRNVASALRLRGHDVVVWTVEREGGYGERRLADIPIRDLPSPLPARTARGLTRFAAAAPRAARLWNSAHRDLHPDVIHVHCFGPNGTYANVLAAVHRTPLIVSSHGETLADDDGVFDESLLARSSLRSAVRRAAAVTGCSQVVLADLEKRYGLQPGSGVVVPNGIDADEAASAIPLEINGPYIAAVGRLQRVKGFDLLITAFARANLAPNVRLVIGGDGPEAAALRDLARRNGVDERVILPGRLDRARVAGLMRDASVVAVPSRFEAFGIAALEAWRAGTPLVVTNRGGPAEFVTHGADGLLCNPNNADELADSLSAVFANRELATALAQNGTARVAAFTWSNTAAAYEGIYAKAVSSTMRNRS